MDDDDFQIGTRLTQEQMLRIQEKHLGTAEEIAFAQRRGFVSKVDLDKRQFTVTVQANEADLRRIAPLMLQGDVVSVVLPPDLCSREKP